MALPTALFATIASFGLASAAVIASVDSQRGTTRDQYSKNAIAAADAGASVGMMRLNRFASALTSSNPCVGLGGSTLVITTTSGDGWCPAITGTVGGATYSYRVSPLASSACGAGPTVSCVVSTGTAGSVSRRVDISFKTITVGSAFDLEGLIGQGDVLLDNNADIRVSIGTNGDVSVSNNANVCGNIRHGVGKKATFGNNGTQCNGYSITSGNVTLPAVSTFIPTDIATNNSNYRLVKCTKTMPTKEPAGCQSDNYSASWSSTVPWNPATRAISTDNNASLTLTGGDYFICSLTLNNNSHLYIGATAQVRIFFDTPENCGLKAGAKQIDIQNNSDITATGYQPQIGQYNLPGFYLLGSPNIQTYASWSNNAGNAEFVLYGPNTDIDISNNATFTGAMAGKTIHINENAIVRQDAGFKPQQIGGATLYQRQSYVECTGAAASPPNANC